MNGKNKYKSAWSAGVFHDGDGESNAASREMELETDK